MIHSLAGFAGHERLIGRRVGVVANKCDREEHAGAPPLDGANPENNAMLTPRVQQLQRLDRGVDSIFGPH